MIVELIGPSGSGKTTAARRLNQDSSINELKLLSLKELRCLERQLGWRKLREDVFKDRAFSKFRRLTALYLKYPGIACPLLALMLLQGRPYRWRAASRAIATFSLSVYLKGHERDRTTILDEGFVQALWALLIGSRKLRGRWLIRRLILAHQRLVSPINIVFSIEPDTARDRVFSRDSKGRFNKESDDELKEQFEFAFDHHRQIVAMMPASAIDATLDGTDTEDDITKRITQVIMTLIQGCDPSQSTGTPVQLSFKAAQH